MNCWKSFNISKQYGSFRLTLLSFVGAVFYYILFYLSFEKTFLNAHFTGYDLVALTAAMFFVWPAHKLLHILPVLMSGKKASLSFEKSRLHSIPVIYTNIPCTLKKRTSVFVVLCPFVLLTAGSCLVSFFLPSYIYFFAVIGAMNFGISTKDLVYFVHLIAAPADAFIEDDRTGCKILIKQAI